MKKNKMMRLASILLVCVLLTTSVIGGTFAKYTTSDTSNDSARVAKWGFEAIDSAIVLDDLFLDAYDTDQTDKTVDSSNTKNVVAPGTANAVKFSFAYDTTSNGIAAPEVDYTFVVDAEITGNYTALDDNANFYWTLNGTKYSKVADLLAAIEALDGDAVKYEAGTLPTAFYGTTPNGAAEHQIGWAWEFETADDASTTDKNEMAIQDAADTAMGNADTLADIEITITVTATQVN